MLLELLPRVKQRLLDHVTVDVCQNNNYCPHKRKGRHDPEAVQEVGEQVISIIIISIRKPQRGSARRANCKQDDDYQSHDWPSLPLRVSYNDGKNRHEK